MMYLFECIDFFYEQHGNSPGKMGQLHLFVRLL